MKDVAAHSNQPSTAGASGELAGHELLVVTLRTGSAEIFRIDPANGDAVNLTCSPDSNDRYPAWSPDGSAIAFTSDRDGTYNLYVMKANGSQVRQLTYEKAPAVAYHPNWSGDGSKIVFGFHSDKASTCSIAPDGSDFRVIAPGHDPCISPDGRLIAYTEWIGGGYVLLLMDIDGQNIRQLTTHENEIGAVTPTFSPDGKTILFSDTVHGALELFSADVATGNIRQLTRLGQMATCPAWSPDMHWISFRLTDEAFWVDPERRQITYAEHRADKRPVWVMGADGSDPRVIEVLRFQCSIDGSRAVWNPKGKQ
jgi:TolB protein